MTRIVVLGGRGFFGRAAVGLLRGFGLAPLAAGRSPRADVMVDAEDGGSIRRGLRAGDVVLDAAGPFQRRTPTLVDAEVRDAAGNLARVALASSGPGFLTAVAPAALACRALAEGRFPHRGLVPPHQAASPEEILDLLAHHGIRLVRG